MDIKVIKQCIVGKSMNPRKVGEIVRDVDDAEAKALITVGYAREAKVSEAKVSEAKVSEAKVKEADENKDAGNADENANQGNAPKNKAK